jgi:hypothetical protein
LLRYSFGGLLAVELEAEGWGRELYLVDISSVFIKSLMAHTIGSDEHSEMNLMCSIFRILAPAAALSEVSYH